MPITLPDNPATSVATSGNDYLLYVDTGTISVPNWTVVGGQQDGTLNDEYKTIEANTKASGGASNYLLGLETWNIDITALVVLNDAGADALKYAFRNRKQVHVKFEFPDGSSQQGWAWITKRPISAKMNEVATMSLTLQGNGALTDVAAPNYTITPEEGSFSKAAPADLSFAISPTSGTVSSVKNGATSLTVTTDYTYAAGALVIKSTYLTAQTNGEVVLTIAMGDGSTFTITITVTA